MNLLILRWDLCSLQVIFVYFPDGIILTKYFLFVFFWIKEHACQTVCLFTKTITVSIAEHQFHVDIGTRSVRVKRRKDITVCEEINIRKMNTKTTLVILVIRFLDLIIRQNKTPPKAVGECRCLKTRNLLSQDSWLGDPRQAQPQSKEVYPMRARMFFF